MMVNSMFAEGFQLFPHQASTLAPSVDWLYFFIVAVNVAITVLVMVLLVAFAIIFRRKSEDELPAPMHGNLPLEIFWTAIPTVICGVIFLWGVKVWSEIVVPPRDATELYVVGRQWMWKIQHPGGQREINAIHVPVGSNFKLIVTAEDVIHSFSIPDFRVKTDAVPGRYNQMWFNATKPGKYHIYCTEYCGTEHSRMIGWIHVMEREDYARWLNEQAEGGDGLQGRKLFTKLQCITCHSDANKAPLLENIFRKDREIGFVDGKPVPPGTRVLADEAYLRESIRNPNAKIHRGFASPTIMPAYDRDLVTEEELLQVITYIRSLKQGETPTRTEETPTPQPITTAEKAAEKAPEKVTEKASGSANK